MKWLDKFKNHEYIKHQEHPEFPLLIFNYTRECQYEDAWDEYTKMSRGLITTEEGEVVARPFEKFFNVGEKEYTKVKNLPKEDPEIYEKMDGSLGILYWWNDQPYIATRGSFTSDQAVFGTHWLYENINYHELDKHLTYLFEIIYPANRIVVNYGDRAELVLLAIKNIESGEEIDYIREAKHLGVSYAPRLESPPTEDPVKELKSILPHLDSNREGFVVKFSDGLRVKMKGDEYVRLHRIVTDLSSKRIWEYLKDGHNIKELLQDVPDEYYKWIKKTKEDLYKEFNKIKSKARSAYNVVEQFETRKEKALYLKEYYNDVKGIVFKMLDDEDYYDLIWKMVEPEHEVPQQSFNE